MIQLSRQVSVYNINILVVLDLSLFFLFAFIPPYLACYTINIAVLFLLVGAKQSSLESTMEVVHVQGGESRRYLRSLTLDRRWYSLDTVKKPAFGEHVVANVGFPTVGAPTFCTL